MLPPAGLGVLPRDLEIPQQLRIDPGGVAVARDHKELAVRNERVQPRERDRLIRHRRPPEANHPLTRRRGFCALFNPGVELVERQGTHVARPPDVELALCRMDVGVDDSRQQGCLLEINYSCLRAGIRLGRRARPDIHNFAVRDRDRLRPRMTAVERVDGSIQKHHVGRGLSRRRLVGATCLERTARESGDGEREQGHPRMSAHHCSPAPPVEHGPTPPSRASYWTGLSRAPYAALTTTMMG